jgi:hypothetical protein
MNDLETTYRDALRWYPMRWRTANEDAVIGTLLDKADDESRETPARGELADLRRSAFRARFTGLVGVVPAAVRDRSAIVALGLGFSIGAAGLAWSIRQFLVIQSVIDSRFTEVGLVDVGFIVYVIWIAAFVTGLFGARRTSMALVASSIPVSIAADVIGYFARFWGSPGAVTLTFLGLLGIVYLAGAPRPRAALRRQIAAVGLGFLAVYYLIVWAGARGYWGNGALGVDSFWGEFAVWLTFLGLPAVIVASIIVWRRSRSPWSPAILIAAIPLLPLALVEFGYATTWLANIGVAVAALIGVAVVIAIMRAFGFRIRITRA